jgi:group I intron endonuclease
MFIYQIINIQNQRVYIGQTKNYNSRFRQHKNKLLSNKHNNLILQTDFNTYTDENFIYQVVECCLDLTQDYVDSREQYWIDNSSKVYNVVKIITRRFWPSCSLNRRIGVKLSEETKQKLSDSKKGKTLGKDNHFYGKKHTEETKLKISAAKKGKTLGEDNHFFNKKHTEETKKIISNKQKERLANVQNHPLYKSSVLIFKHKKTNEIYEGTQNDFKLFLLNKTGYASAGNISSLINCKIRTYKGFYFVGVKF